MGSALPTLLVVGVMALAGFVLINPELRCSVMNLCGGSVPRGAAPEEEEEEEPEEEEAPAQPPVVNVYNPAPVITPPPIVVRPQYYPQTQSAVHDCCDCRMINGRAKCRTHNSNGYTISYSSARYDVREAARLCARSKCYQPTPRPQPPTCRTEITKHGRKYYITNLKNLPAVMTMQFPPTYVKEGNCVYQLIQSSPPPAPNTPPQTDNKDCQSYLCKTYPFLCPKCASANYVRTNPSSLFNTGKVAY